MLPVAIFSYARISYRVGGRKIGSVYNLFVLVCARREVACLRVKPVPSYAYFLRAKLISFVIVLFHDGSSEV